MAKAKEPPLWAPMFSLPNVHVKFPIDVDGFALVAPDDFRIKAIKKQQPRLGSFLKRFKTEFGDPVQPSTIIWRKDKPDTYRVRRRAARAFCTMFLNAKSVLRPHVPKLRFAR
jgi:hypothetical protein